jgi:hypothetical protein
MRTTVLILLALSGAWLAPPGASAQRTLFGTLDHDHRDDRGGWDRWGGSMDARIWIEGDRDFFERGDRMRVRFRTTEDAYVAVLHIDPEGRLEVAYPVSPFDDGFVRAGRSYPVGSRASALGFPVHRSPGIGYWYILASPVPLDYRAFGDRRTSRWDLGGYGGFVRGDPFYALDQIGRQLLPDWRFVPHAVDFYSYSVGGRHRYPTYACYDGYGGSLSGWNPYYTSCSSIHGLLRTQPYYYDTRRYRGDRIVYLREVRPVAGYQYKEPALPGGRAVQTRELRPTPAQTAPRSGSVAPQRPADRRPEAAPPAAGGGARPTLERRPEPRATPQPEARPPARTRPEAQRPQAEEPRTPAAEPQAPRRDPPARTEPRREQPRQAEPRQAEPRQSEPRQSEPRQAEPRREQAPPRAESREPARPAAQPRPAPSRPRPEAPPPERTERRPSA